MRVLSKAVWDLVHSGLEARLAINAITQSWDHRADVMLEAANDHSAKEGLDPELGRQFWLYVLFESWINLELGPNGRRAFLYNLALKEGSKPDDDSLIGSQDSAAIIARSWVAERLDLVGKDPSEAVRKSVVRFKESVRAGPIFVLSTADCHLHFLNGNKALKAMGLE